MKNKVFITVLTVLLVAVLAAQAFLFVKVYKMDAALAELQPKEDEKEVIRIDTSVIQVDTPYGVLKYPSEWIDQIGIETSTNGDIYTVLFSTKMKGTSFTLFSVIFGDENATEQIGTIEHNGEMVPVAIMEGLIDPAEWSAEEYQKLTKMMTIKDAVKDSIFKK